MGNFKVAAMTVGCKVNQYDTSAILELFENRGFTKVDFSALADVYIISTCTVTAVADKKSRQMINKAKKNNANAMVVAVGCLSQSEGEDLKQKCNVDVVVGNSDRSVIVDTVLDAINESENDRIVNDHIRDEVIFEELFISKASDKTRAFIKIQEGCNNFCSYCIIPFVRGKARSRKVSNIIDEAVRLIKNGVLEIVLTGIHVSSYGLDFDDETSLLSLMIKLDKIEGLKRLRLGSIEPLLITDDFCIRAFKLTTFCPHFHLSLQSGCTSVLKRMNRKYTADDYFSRTQIIKKHFSDPAITTDIIVGFPGETQQEFDSTCDFVKKVGFSKIHIFPYSVRQGTVAASMKDHVDNRTKKSRVAVLSAIDQKLQAAFAKQFLNKTVSVLFEEHDKNNTGNFLGYSKRYVKVSGKAKNNTIKDVTIKKIVGEQAFEG
jgi:threonylcarbamoyladenosine tRNA methylthiotransferase MtaB